jgi:hypothetical protein
MERFILTISSIMDLFAQLARFRENRPWRKLELRKF